jgi:8-oxo-dGTP pyrophosphatase MutT (NUDIX family)
MIRQTTLVFLVKEKEGKMTDICLAMKLRGLGKGRWNGVGGKLKSDETIEECARREAYEEIGVSLGSLDLVASIEFYFPHSPSIDHSCYTYICRSWQGDPSPSAEMVPQWFKVEDIPYDNMWADDRYWLPRVIAGEKIKAKIVFGEADQVISHEVITCKEIALS